MVLASILGEGPALNLLDGEVRAGRAQQLCAGLLAGQGGKEERRVVGAVALVDAGAALEQLEHDLGAARDGGEVDGRVPGVVGRLEELAALALEQLLDDADLLV